MSQPRQYNQTNTFNDWTTTNPSDPHIGSKFDTEFTELKQNTDDLNTNIALIQRDDGKLKNESVHKDAFDQDALALIGASGSGFNPKGDWAASTAYVAGDIVNNNDATYLTATSSFTSAASFSADSANWTLIANAAISTSGAEVRTASGDGSNKVFATGYKYSSVTDIQVFISGVLVATNLYTITNSGGSNNITFTTAPASGTNNVIIWGDSVVSQAASAATKAYRDTTSNHKTTASRWAYLTNATVVDAETSADSSEYSAKEYAIGTTVAAGSAKDWAVLPEDSAVTGSSYSALHHAAKSAASATASASSATASATSFDNFDDRFLGGHTTAEREVGSANIGKDHDGDALVAGALYFDTTLGVMKVWTGTVWRQMIPTATDQTNIDTLVTGKDGTASTSGTTLNMALINTTVANLADVNNFANRYRIGASDPTTSKDDGDLFWNTTTDEMKVYDATSSSWVVPYLDSYSVDTVANNAAVAMSIALG